MFHKYQHIVRVTPESLKSDLGGLLDGTVHIFTKLDGANHCVWYDADSDTVKCASRNHELSEGNDSTKFYHYVQQDKTLQNLAKLFPHWIIYGEFLTPHIIKDYDAEAYNKFFVFDVRDTRTHRYVPYDEYASVMSTCGIRYIPLSSVLTNPTLEEILECVDKSTFLHDNMPGEGIVIKNYNYKNVYGYQVWGKVLTEEYKTTKAVKLAGGKDNSPEEKFVAKYITREFVQKEGYKYLDYIGESWRMEMTPEVLPRIKTAFVEDYLNEIISELKVTDWNELFKAISRMSIKYLKKL